MTAAVLAAVSGFLGGPSPDGDEWYFDFGEHLESNWGAVYGGAIAAGTLAVARSVAPDRSPRSLHLQIVRSVPRGPCLRHHQGSPHGPHCRDRRGRPLRRTTKAGGHRPPHDGHTGCAGRPNTTSPRPSPSRRLTLRPAASDFGVECPNHRVTQHGAATRMVRWPISPSDNMRPSVDGLAHRPFASAPSRGDDLEVTGPESACLVADASVGAPSGQLDPPIRTTSARTPISLCASRQHQQLARHHRCRERSSRCSTASTSIGIEVQAGDHQLAHGLATSLLLPPA